MIENVLKIDQIARISSRAEHSAFTDLLPVGGEHLLCCYRQATNHVSRDGVIEVSKMTLAGNVHSRQRIALADHDLRDPKLSRDASGKLWLIAQARHADQDNQTLGRKMVSWFSEDGSSWSSPHTLGLPGWWLWRIHWQGDEAVGLAYNRAQDRVDLYRGHPGKRMFCVNPHTLSLQKHQLGYPNESDLHTDSKGNLWALVRRDADTFTAQLGMSATPYRRWQWQDLGQYIGGPAWHPLTEDTMLVAGREYTGKALVTSVWTLHLPTGAMQKCLTLPSDGDNSYPGLHISGDDIYISYYSQHLDNQVRVYLARVTGANRLRDVVEQT
ncbi:hypothetical protein OCL06_10215 [Alteromonas sp. ASW11-19]|uniref:Exo-alpha-sialidase n=1 Tax=Alteromonas salexigens TaxID=2982530 RepID=A0ABT2VNY3_9ALTE|nr:hypothetical protein [Alteromonas salexigens]MCU7554974.1 hypothetical protein [Alteromonas salexigens]